MLSRLQKVENDNIENLNSFLQNELDNLYNLRLPMKIDMNIQAFKIKENDKETLFQHLLASKFIGQIALNHYHNSCYYTPFKIYTTNVLETIEDKEDMKTYKELLEKLTDDKICDEKCLKEIIKSSVIIYLTVFKILQSIEESKLLSCHSECEVNKSFEFKEKDEDQTIVAEDSWKCNLCDTMNDDKMSKCKGCEEKKTEVEGNLTNEENNFELNKNEKDSLITSDNEEPVLVRWTCSKCTMLNVFEDELCKACEEHGHHYNKWRCGQCTMINDKLELKCQACQQSNPFIETCGHCHVRKINNKHNKMCEECKENNEKEKSYLKKESNEASGKVEGWSCSKCSLLNSFDLERCKACDNVGPHYNKWRCGQCTCFNDYYLSTCKACHSYKPYDNKDEYIKTNKKKVYPKKQSKQRNFTERNSLVFNSLNSESRCLCGQAVNRLNTSLSGRCTMCSEERKSKAQPLRYNKLINKSMYTVTTMKKPQTLSKNKIHKFCDKNLCKRCSGALLNDEEDLCCICNIKYCVCENVRCRKVFSVRKSRCTFCGKYPYKVTNLDSWACPWRGCEQLNNISSFVCGKCNCGRDVSDCDRKCLFCGWIDFNDNKCIKCKQDFEVDNQEWRCSWSECSYMNVESKLCCYKCNCYRESLRTLKCHHCGYIQSRRTKCQKCQRIYRLLSTDETKSKLVMPQTFNKKIIQSEEINDFTKLQTINVVGEYSQTESEVIIKKDVTKEVRQCLMCKDIVKDSEEELCSICKEEYYKCPSKDCGKIMEVKQLCCEDCGTNTWRCTWKECRGFNEESKDLCKNCCSFRDISARRIECCKCGWIKGLESVCQKCGNSF